MSEHRRVRDEAWGRLAEMTSAGLDARNANAFMKVLGVYVAACIDFADECRQTRDANTAAAAPQLSADAVGAQIATHLRPFLARLQRIERELAALEGERLKSEAAQLEKRATDLRREAGGRVVQLLSLHNVEDADLEALILKGQPPAGTSAA